MILFSEITIRNICKTIKRVDSIYHEKSSVNKFINRIWIILRPRFKGKKLLQIVKIKIDWRDQSYSL
jgi:hypothetical protein